MDFSSQPFAEARDVETRLEKDVSNAKPRSIRTVPTKDGRVAQCSIGLSRRRNLDRVSRLQAKNDCVENDCRSLILMVEMEQERRRNERTCERTHTGE
jgi:hypothetical protein